MAETIWLPIHFPKEKESQSNYVNKRIILKDYVKTIRPNRTIRIYDIFDQKYSLENNKEARKHTTRRA